VGDNPSKLAQAQGLHLDERFAPVRNGRSA